MYTYVLHAVKKCLTEKKCSSENQNDNHLFNFNLIFFFFFPNSLIHDVPDAPIHIDSLQFRTFIFVGNDTIGPRCVRCNEIDCIMASVKKKLQNFAKITQRIHAESNWNRKAKMKKNLGRRIQEKSILKTTTKPNWCDTQNDLLLQVRKQRISVREDATNKKLIEQKEKKNWRNTIWYQKKTWASKWTT